MISWKSSVATHCKPDLMNKCYAPQKKLAFSSNMPGSFLCFFMEIEHADPTFHLTFLVIVNNHHACLIWQSVEQMRRIAELLYWQAEPRYYTATHNTCKHSTNIAEQINAALYSFWMIPSDPCGFAVYPRMDNVLYIIFGHATPHGHFYRHTYSHLFRCLDLTTNTEHCLLNLLYLIIPNHWKDKCPRMFCNVSLVPKVFGAVNR